jgi:hypothetical protein
MVFENRMLRRLFRLRKDKITWELGKVHNEELKEKILFE